MSYFVTCQICKKEAPKMDESDLVDVYKKYNNFSRIISRYLKLDDFYFLKEKTLKRNSCVLIHFDKTIWDQCMSHVSAILNYYREMEEADLRLSFHLLELADILDMNNPPDESKSSFESDFIKEVRRARRGVPNLVLKKCPLRVETEEESKGTVSSPSFSQADTSSSLFQTEQRSEAKIIDCHSRTQDEILPSGGISSSDHGSSGNASGVPNGNKKSHNKSIKIDFSRKQFRRRDSSCSKISSRAGKCCKIYRKFPNTHSIPSMLCSYCGFKARTERGLRAHISIHLKAKPMVRYRPVSKQSTSKELRCTRCSAEFETIAELVIHAQDVHGGDLVSCRICKKKIPNVRRA